MAPEAADDFCRRGKGRAGGGGPMRWQRRSLAHRLRVREAQQRATAELGQAGLTGQPLELLLPAAATSIARVLDLPVVNVLRSDTDGEDFTFVAVHGWDKPVGSPATLG